MKIRNIVLGILLTSALVGTAGWAQEKPADPAKDELAVAWLDTAKVAAQLANSECQSLASVKQFTGIRTQTQQKVEAKFPGYTIDWNNFTIVKKPATTPAVK
jgi:hypothetical protein